MKFININYIFLVPKHWNVCSIMGPLWEESSGFPHKISNAEFW